MYSFSGLVHDIHVVHETFGLEAARTILLKEYRSIGTGGEFKTINFAHISILVDFMCSTGKIVSIDRYGLNKLNTSPLTRASFEETHTVLQDIHIILQEIYIVLSEMYETIQEMFNNYKTYQIFCRLFIT